LINAYSVPGWRVVCSLSGVSEERNGRGSARRRSSSSGSMFGRALALNGGGGAARKASIRSALCAVPNASNGGYSSQDVVYLDTFDERETGQVSMDAATGLTLTGSAPGQSPRDAEGRSLAGKKKPLKINLDLALVCGG